MKRNFLLVVLLLLLTTACSNSTESWWVLENDQISKSPEIQAYVNQLQTDKKDYKGYKVFTIAKGKKAVVISLGKEGKKLELVEVHTSSKDTAITIEETEQSTDDANPYIVVGMDEIVGAFYVYAQQTEEYTGSGYYD
ncbi:hypothetical protein AM500_04720 [Bacillus sp. FJAT-18017]|uniref:hypothetical protein n=1 Tax=Bacillus sp. FJAT-18017 TaxID=1705566 RepID=UPI0006B0227F|nr:hypothetical protein [Bacillus sp. FJAT-18017]ALC89169.1 hypothetical protein AM500_04720 [Bacillus sp. FJAT-18017]